MPCVRISPLARDWILEVLPPKQSPEVTILSKEKGHFTRTGCSSGTRLNKFRAPLSFFGATEPKRKKEDFKLGGWIKALHMPLFPHPAPLLQNLRYLVRCHHLLLQSSGTFHKSKLPFKNVIGAFILMQWNCLQLFMRNIKIRVFEKVAMITYYDSNWNTHIHCNIMVVKTSLFEMSWLSQKAQKS